MPNDNVEQEQVEVVDLFNETPEAPTSERKGYEYYAKKAEQEAAANSDGHVTDKASDDGIPDKFKGKSVSDIIESYTKLEQEFGRRNNEVGSLRKLTDQLLELNEPSKAKTPERKKVEVDTLLEDPDTAINEAVDSNPRLKAIEDKLLQQSVAEHKAVFEQAHPNWETTLNTPEFAEWIKASPVRQRMLVEADRDYDYVTGKELFDNYQMAVGSKIADATETRNTNARAAAKKAVTEAGGDNSPKPTRKFKRSELIKLKLYNPSKYEAMRDEIMEAYATGNVI